MTIFIYSYAKFYDGMFQCKNTFTVAYNIDFHLLHIERHLRDRDFDPRDYVDISRHM